MKVIRRAFESKDFKKVSDFLKETYSEKSGNWTIERWSWSRFFNGYWLEGFDSWPTTVGMWVDENDAIVAMCLNEGEIEGDVFFQLRDFDYDENFIHEMMDFAEENLSAKIESKKHLLPRVNNSNKELFLKVLHERGYSYTEKNETDATIELKEYQTVILPRGYAIELAKNFDASKRALAHGRAFSVEPARIQALMNARTRAYTGLGKSPDYNENLDLCIVDEHNQIVAFATFWFDEKNLIGSLEPLGTDFDYQKKGLGKALIHEGMNRLKKLGATKLHVGSDQLFYMKIGFKPQLITEIWQKEFD